MATVTLLPASEVTREWSTLGDPDEVTSYMNDASDDTYIYTGTLNYIHSFMLDTMPASSAISEVKAYIRAQDSGTGTNQIKLYCSDGSNVSLGTAYECTTSIAESSYVFTSAPDAGGWTTAKINACSFGVKCTALATSRTVYAYDLWVIVTYTEPTSETTVTVRAASRLHLDRTQTSRAASRLHLDRTQTSRLAEVTKLESTLKTRLAEVVSLLVGSIGTSRTASSLISERQKTVRESQSLTLVFLDFPAPTELLCDFTSSEVVATGENVTFSAIFHGGVANATHAQVQISKGETEDFLEADIVNDSGWLAITSTANGARCSNIVRDLSTLSSYVGNSYGAYRWRIRFKSGLVTSLWEAAFSDESPALFTISQRAWANPATTFRRRLTFDPNHPALPIDYTASFKLPTGTRYKIASDGAFNEAIQFSTCQVLYTEGKTHVCYLSSTSDIDGDYGVSIQSYDHLTQVWGTPLRVDSALTTFDTHCYPVIFRDNAGYLHLIYGAHESGLTHAVSTVPNQSGSLPTDTYVGLPTSAWATAAGISALATYPVPIYEETTGVVFVFFRIPSIVGSENRLAFGFVYSTDNGVSWSAKQYAVVNNDVDGYRTYCYGVYYDQKTKRLHIGFSFVKIGNITNGVWYAYADMESSTAPYFRTWYKMDGTVCGTTTIPTTTTLQPGHSIIVGATSAYLVSTTTLSVGSYINVYNGETQTGVDIQLSGVDHNTGIVTWVGGINGSFAVSTTTITDLVLNHVVTRATADLVIESASDGSMNYFCQGLTVTKTGNPLLIVTEENGLRGAYSDLAFGVCRYYSGAWHHTSISEVHDIVNQRTLYPTICDRDGVLHMYTGQDSRRFVHHVPTSDSAVSGHNVAVNVGGGSSRYEAVDDGIHNMDWDATYLYGNGAAQLCGFSSSKTLPTGVTILKVGVETVTKLPTANTTYKHFIRIGTTDYYSSPAITSTANASYALYTTYWETNPSLSSPNDAWTEAAVNALEFGYSDTSTSSTSRTSRCNRVVEVNSASDDELWGREIVHLMSSDDGDNWTAIRTSENSYVGLLMVGGKMYYSNDQIEVVWSSGNDLFYYTNIPYGLVRKDARDLRVRWGATEIDRIIDYADYGETTVRFKLQEVVAAGATAGSKDYYVEYGNPNETTEPLSDPHNVLLAFEGFETFSEGHDIAGSRGWTIETGTSAKAVVAGAVDDTGHHHNKVYSGAVSMATYATDVRKSLGGTYSDINVRAALWEDSGDYQEICLINGSGQKFGAGKVNATGYYGAYDVNGTWHVDPVYRCGQCVYDVFDVQVTSAGCSAWLNGKLLADEVSGITDAVSLSCQNGSNAYKGYFDHIEVSRRIQKRVLRQTITDFDQSISYDPSHTAELAYGDEKYDSITCSNLCRIDVTVRAHLTSALSGKTASIHCWLSTGSSYSAETVVDDLYATVNLPTNTFWVSTTFSFSNLPIGETYSTKVDFYAGNATGDTEVEYYSIAVYGYDLDPVIVVGEQEVKGFYIDASILGGRQLQLQIDATVYGYETVSKLAERVTSLDKTLTQRLSTQITSLDKTLTQRLSTQITSLDKTLTARLISLLTQEKTLTSKVSESLYSDKTVLQRVSELLTMDRIFTDRLSTYLESDKVLLARLALKVYQELTASSRVVEMILTDKTLTDRLVEVLTTDKTLTTRLTGTLVTDKVLLARLALKVYQELTASSRVAEMIAADKILTVRLAEQLVGEEMITSRFSSLLKLEQPAVVRLAQSLLTDKWLIQRIATTLVTDRQTVTRFAQSLGLDRAQTTRFAEQNTLEALLTTRLAEVVKSDKTSTARLEMLLHLDETSLTRLAEKLEFDKTKVDRVAGLLSVDRVTAVRVSQLLSLDKLLLTRFANKLGLTYEQVSLVASDLLREKIVVGRVSHSTDISSGETINYKRSAAALSLDKSELVELAQLLIVSKELRARLGSQLSTYKEVFQQIAEALQLDRTQVLRLVQVLTTDKTEISRLTDGVSLDKSLLARLASSIARDRTVQERVAEKLELDKTYLSRVATLLQVDRATATRVVQFLTLDKLILTRLAQEFNLTYERVNLLASTLVREKVVTWRVSQGVDVSSGITIDTRRAAGLLNLDRTSLVRLAQEAIVDRSTVVRVSSKVSANREVLFRVAETLSLDRSQLLRLAQALTVDRASVTHLSSSVGLDKMVVVGLANYFFGDRTTTLRLANGAMGNKSSLVRLASSFVTDKTVLQRIAASLKIEATAVERLVELLTIDAVLTSRLTGSLDLDRIKEQRVGQLVSFLGLGTVATSRVAQSIIREATTTRRLAESLLGELVVTRRQAHDLTLNLEDSMRTAHRLVQEALTSARIAAKVKLEISESKRIAQYLKLALESTAKLATLLRMDATALMRVSGITNLQHENQKRLSQLFQLTYELTSQLSSMSYIEASKILYLAMTLSFRGNVEEVLFEPREVEVFNLTNTFVSPSTQLDKTQAVEVLGLTDTVVSPSTQFDTTVVTKPVNLD